MCWKRLLISNCPPFFYNYPCFKLNLVSSCPWNNISWYLVSTNFTRKIELNTNQRNIIPSFCVPLWDNAFRDFSGWKGGAPSNRLFEYFNYSSKEVTTFNAGRSVGSQYLGYKLCARLKPILQKQTFEEFFKAHSFVSTFMFVWQVGRVQFLQPQKSHLTFLLKIPIAPETKFEKIKT